MHVVHAEAHSHSHTPHGHGHSLSPVGSSHGMSFPSPGGGLYHAHSEGGYGHGYGYEPVRQGSYTPVHSVPVGHGQLGHAAYAPYAPQGHHQAYPAPGHYPTQQPGYGYGQGYEGMGSYPAHAGHGYARTSSFDVDGLGPWLDCFVRFLVAVCVVVVVVVLYVVRAWYECAVRRAGRCGGERERKGWDTGGYHVGAAGRRRDRGEAEAKAVGEDGQDVE